MIKNRKQYIDPNTFNSSVTPSALRKMGKQRKKDIMKHWFFERFENPAERTPYESKEGGYIYIWGGPFQVWEQLGDEFSGMIDDDLVEEAAKEIEDKTSCYDWTYKPRPDDYDTYEIEAALDEKAQRDGVYGNLDLMRRLLQEKDLMDASLHKFQLMMIFGFCITILESYLSDNFAREVFSDQKLKQKYLKAETSLANQKFSLDALYETHGNIDKIIKDKLGKTTFHNLPVAKGLYKQVLDIEFDDFDYLIKAVEKRHDFIHRGGKDKDNNEVVTSKEEVNKLIEKIEEFCKSVDKKGLDRKKSCPKL